MVNASVEWIECNTTATQDTNVSFGHYGNVASASLDPTANPISPGSVSFEKWHRLKVTLHDSTKFSDVKFWLSGTEPANTSAYTNCSKGAFTNATQGFWRAPAATDEYLAYAVESATPSGANFGIDGSTTASITQDASGTNSTGITDFFIHGIITAAGATEGPAAAYTMHVSFDEVR